MGESISKKIEEYEKKLYDKQIGKIISGFYSIKQRIINDINDNVSKIAANLKKNKQYDNMMSGITSFKNEIKGKITDSTIDGYELNSENSAKEITASELEDLYTPDEESLGKLNERIKECEKEALTKGNYYNKWLGSGQNVSTTSLLSLVSLYNYDDNAGNAAEGGAISGSPLKLANVLKNQKITATLDVNQKDSNYLTLEGSLREDAEQEVKAQLKSGDFSFEFAKQDYIVDDLLAGINKCLLKLQAYNNYCDTVWMMLSNYLYGTDDNSQDSFARKMDDFFGQEKTHANNKEVLNDKNACQREMAEYSGETFANERLEDYYYKEDTSAPYFEKFKDRANEYDKKLDERKNFIKSFCDEFEGGISPFVKKEDMAKVGGLELDNQNLTDELQSQDGVSVELQDLKIVNVKIRWSSDGSKKDASEGVQGIFPAGVQGPWSEEWETKKTTVDVGGDMEVDYPLAFDKFDGEFKECAEWLGTLKTDVDRLDKNLDTMRTYKEKIAAEIERQKAEEEAKKAEEARQKAEEEAAKRAEEEAQRRQEELEALEEAMKGGGDE